jgi:hypothetical protein
VLKVGLGECSSESTAEYIETQGKRSEFVVEIF